MSDKQWVKNGGLLAAGLTGLAANSEAATFTVTNTNDAGAGSLRQAILDANGAAGADTIVFQAGVTGTITLTTGQLALTDSVTINGPGAANLTVSGNNASRVFYLYASAPFAAEINNLRIVDGASVTFGAGIINFSSDLTLDNVVIEGCDASAGGGALAATDLLGGQMDIVIRNSSLTGNTSGRDGGAVYFYTTGGQFRVENSTISNNTATQDGGGIYLYHSNGTTNVVNSTISGNTAAVLGGGLSLYQIDGSFNVSGSTFSTNAGAYGGGAFAIFSDIPTNVENSTFSGNSATGAGGGVFFYYGALELNHVTVASNSSAAAGGVLSGAALSLGVSGSILADNTAATDPDLGGTVALANTLVEAPGTAAITDNGGNILNQDPALGALANNGGPTLTHLPAANSVALNTFNSALVTDQRGLPRPSGANDDLGAVEFQVSTVTVSTAAQSVAEEAGTATVTLQRTAGDGAASVDYATADGTAFAGTDFTTNNGTVNWLAGDVADKTVAVAILDDAAAEPSENFSFTLSNPVGAVLGATSAQTITITDTDVPPSNIDFVAANTATGESGGGVTLTLQRLGDVSAAASVTVSTADGTAGAPADYTTTNTVVNWAAGDGANKTVIIPIVSDLLVEGPETFTATLTLPTGASLGTNQVNTITITDDDFTPVPVNNPWALVAGALGLFGLGAMARKRRSTNGPLAAVLLSVGLAGLFGASSSEAANPQRQGVVGVVAQAEVQGATTTVRLQDGRTLALDSAKLQVIDRRQRGFGVSRTISAVTPGMPVLVKSRQKRDGSYRIVRVVLFNSVADAEAAARN